MIFSPSPLLLPLANCGSPPGGDGTVSLSTMTGPYIGNPPSVVSNIGAMATYTCVDANADLVGVAQLTCQETISGTSVDWMPLNPPVCVPGKYVASCIELRITIRAVPSVFRVDGKMGTC